jgi:hypothetical protein
MSEASFASLSPTLLARKGGAKPAMRPQLAAALGQLTGPAAAANLEDLGWNDMGEDDAPRNAEVVHLTPAPHNDQADEEAHEQDLVTASLLAEARQPAVKKQRVDLAARIDARAEEEIADGSEFDSHPEPLTRRRRPRARKPAADRGSRAAFTLRLDPDRHLKLRLACTVKGRSAQQLVTEALDALLERMPDIDSLAAQVQRN